MILSSSLEVGQITFFIRVAIQILSYGGAALMLTIILGKAPRVASVDTHDTINRIVGASTQTKQTALWVFRRMRGQSTDSSTSKDLVLVLLIYISYAAFVSLSDLGFLGFFACSVPGSNFFDTPASVNSTQGAVNLVGFNMINETDPQSVKVHRCDAAQKVQFDENVVLNVCSSWKNSTYADRSLFNGLNSTDSDVLMLRSLSSHNHSRQAVFDLNTYYIGPSSQRISTPTIQSGMAVSPHETGLTIVIGVPNLAPETSVQLDQTMAIELDVGCMTVGMYAQHELAASGTGIDVFRTNGSWRKYTGPEYMVDVLTNFTDQIREYSLPFFNQSTLSSSGYLSTNKTNVILSTAANVGSWRLQTQGLLDTDKQLALLGNCTAAMWNKLGLANPYDKIQQGNMCNLLGLGGRVDGGGVPVTGFSKMLCASATQVNMVSANIAMNVNGSVSVQVTRLPSDLHYTNADYFDVTQTANGTRFFTFDAIERFTLSPNPNAPTSHFIPSRSLLLSDNTLGPGSAGVAISSLGHSVLDVNGAFDSKVEYAGLRLLDQGFGQVNFTNDLVTRWMGQVGGSFFLTSAGYNGWAALNSPRVQVVSTGGRAGTCYKPLFAFGFLPLLLAAGLIVIWALAMLLRSSLFGTAPLKNSYGGLNPYVDALYANDLSKDALLTWEVAPKPHLQMVSKFSPATGDTSGTALKFLKSGHEVAGSLPPSP